MASPQYRSELSNLGRGWSQRCLAIRSDRCSRSGSICLRQLQGLGRNLDDARLRCFRCAWNAAKLLTCGGFQVAYFKEAQLENLHPPIHQLLRQLVPLGLCRFRLLYLRMGM